MFQKYFFLAELKTWLLAQPEVAGSLLSGSGSTVLAVLRSDSDDRERLAERAVRQFGELWTLSCDTAPADASA